MRNLHWISAMVALVGVIAFASSTRADMIYATTCTSSSSATDLTAGSVASNAIDKNTTSAWYTSSAGNVNSDYFGGTNTAPVLTFDLGSTYNLTGFELFNFTIYAGNGAKTFTLQFSTDGLAWTTVGTSSDTTVITSKTPLIATNGNNWEIYSLASSVTARYVKMTITDNWYGAVISGSTITGNRVGINEMEFIGSAVPEPTTMVLFGSSVVALLAFAWKKRRKM